MNITDINKEFIFTGYLSSYFKYITTCGMFCDAGEVIVKVGKINMAEVTLSVVSVEKIDTVIDEVVRVLTEQLKKDLVSYKETYNKIINEWDNNPDSFRENRYNEHNIYYTNRNVLNNDEYGKNDSLFTVFEKYSSFYDGRYMAGWGEFTYVSLAKIKKALKGVDKFYEGEMKKLSSEETKKKFKKYILAMKMVIPINSIDLNIKVK